MMNSQSLPFSSSQSIVHTKLTQLPFSPSPSSSSAVSRFQLPPSPDQSQVFGRIPIGPHNRSESIVSRHSRAQRSGTIGNESISPSSSTHAGGVLPAAAFFHPSRPRPSSAGSVSSTQEFSDSLHMVPEHSVGSDAEDEKLYRQLSTSTKFSTRQKQSREPLLPIGPVRRPTLTSQKPPTRPSFSHIPPSPSGNMSISSSRMKISFDKVFKRRFSFESAVKSAQSLGRITTRDSLPRNDSLMIDERMTFELKPTAEGRSSPTPTYSRKTSESHVYMKTSLKSNRLGGFVPTRPPGSPDLFKVPMVDSKGHPVYNYTLHRSRNRFFCRGYLLTGGDSPWAFIGSLIVVFGITGVYFGTTCVWWWKNESPAVAAVGAYMTLLTISSMLTTAFSDPGILPRDLDPDPPYPSHSPSDGTVRTPLPRDLKVRAGVVRVKYCSTCKTYRPPRSSHCKMCDNCVDGCDHHCQWINNCVGRRNYTSFFVFLLTAVLTLVLIIVTSALHLYLITAKEHVDFPRALHLGIGSAVAFALSVVIIWPVTALLVYHLRLLVLNATTIEQIRNQAHKTLVSGPAPPNPFSHGTWRYNLAYVLCRPAGLSWLDATSVATEDKRAINPGMESNNPGDRKSVV